MLTPEEGQRRLASFAIVDADARISRRLADLPPRLCAIANEHVRMHLRRHTVGWGTDEGLAWRVERARELDALSIEDRRSIFAAFFPKLGAEVELGWRALVAQPYQESVARRAFRSPRHPDHSASKRVGWLNELLDVVSPYEEDAAWLAAWTGHFPHFWRCETNGRLLAAVIDGGGARGDEVLRILLATADGTHETAVFQRYVIRALATCARPEAWAALERLVLRAQREEGLRQVIFETVDEAHPECFRRMLALVAEHDLARFSAVARATDVWLAMAWDSQAARHVASIAERLSRSIVDPDARRAALASDAAEDVYLALFAAALEDSVRAAELARPLARHARADVRFAAAYLLAELDHAEARAALTDFVADPDRRVAARAIDAFRRAADCVPDVPDLFERLEAQLARWPAKSAKEPAILWPWCEQELDRTRIGSALFASLRQRPLARLAEHLDVLDVLDVATRVRLAELLAARPDAAGARALTFALLGDAGSFVRLKAREALARSTLRAGEELACEALLARKTADLRLGVLELLLALDDERARASAERLLDARDAGQRAGGLELLRRLHDAGRLVAWCRERAQAFRAATANPTAAETAQLDALAQPQAEIWTFDDALGLAPESARTPLPAPRAGVDPTTRASRDLLFALDALVARHAATPIRIESPYDHHASEIPLGQLSEWAVVRPPSGDRARSREALPLRAVFEDFWVSRDAQLRDRDGFEGVRALLHGGSGSSTRARWRWFQRARGKIADEDAPKTAFPSACAAYLHWFLYLEDPPGARSFLLDATESALAQVTDADVVASRSAPDAPSMARADTAFSVTEQHWLDTRAAWSDDELRRLWNLRRSAAERELAASAHAPVWVAAYERGIARDEDVCAWLLPPPREGPPTFAGYYQDLWPLRQLSRRRTWDGQPIPPRTFALVERVRQRLVAIELARGETPAVSSAACAALRWTGGLDVLARVSRALAGGSLRRGTSTGGSGRERSLSDVTQRTQPELADTHERFVAALPPAEIGEERLLEVAMLAPQWCGHVEHALGWRGLADGVWWMHAHTKDSAWSVDEDLRALWSAQTSERTPLSAQDLIDGAVDVAWYARVRGHLGDERAARLLQIAKYTSTGTGHTRAKLFASALLGRERADALTERVRSKRHLDSVRALGLVPLPEDAKPRAAEVLARYLALQEFVRGSRQFGSARQASEKRAAAIGLENLARTAGYADPARLEWAMERAALGELAAGSVRASAGEVEVELSIDADGDAALVARKNGKALKAIPPAAKKDAAVKALVDQSAALAKQKQRMRASLEEAMVRGDAFTGAELAELCENPVLAPMLARLALAGEHGVGYPVDGGRALRCHDGRTNAIDAAARVRIAHPLDLLSTNAWSAWQRDLLRREVVQPFKQVFRELYVLTSAEREERVRSLRYAGHQVQPKQALALLGARGWTWHPEEGARRVDHASGIAARLAFLHAPYTPAEVEGLTVEAVSFVRRGLHEPLPLDSVPPRLLSEVLRDVDLVVSVASRSGVDAEASASSVESRAALVRETCALLSLANVSIDGRHVVIEGQLGRYTIHLGSGVVHKLPGGHLCIVPVHAQHRGRVFLPFADDDPKTAEILSKVLLLARDAEIKDPTILEQIRR